mmetsp:Transcript_5145/g.15055  ORF Transcript_5145/g.15055 Transcript_5145/m.15055 type:complete len:613 (+) Transcript_5145:1798-3636(+)
MRKTIHRAKERDKAASSFPDRRGNDDPKAMSSNAAVPTTMATMRMTMSPQEQMWNILCGHEIDPCHSSIVIANHATAHATAEGRNDRTCHDHEPKLVLEASSEIDWHEFLARGYTWDQFEEVVIRYNWIRIGSVDIGCDYFIWSWQGVQLSKIALRDHASKHHQQQRFTCNAIDDGYPPRCLLHSFLSDLFFKSRYNTAVINSNAIGNNNNLHQHAMGNNCVIKDMQYFIQNFLPVPSSIRSNTSHLSSLPDEDHMDQSHFFATRVPVETVARTTTIENLRIGTYLCETQITTPILERLIQHARHLEFYHCSFDVDHDANGMTYSSKTSVHPPTLWCKTESIFLQNCVGHDADDGVSSSSFLVNVLNRCPSLLELKYEGCRSGSSSTRRSHQHNRNDSIVNNVNDLADAIRRHPTLKKVNISGFPLCDDHLRRNDTTTTATIESRGDLLLLVLLLKCPNLTHLAVADSCAWNSYQHDPVLPRLLPRDGDGNMSEQWDDINNKIFAAVQQQVNLRYLQYNIGGGMRTNNFKIDVLIPYIRNRRILSNAMHSAKSITDNSSNKWTENNNAGNDLKYLLFLLLLTRRSSSPAREWKTTEMFELLRQSAGAIMWLS